MSTNPKTKIQDVATAKKPRAKSRLKSPEEVNHRDKLEPIPASAHENPVKWAEEHVTTLVPQAAKEVEYALKFGTNPTRLNIALEIMAMKGISSKQQQPVNQVPAIVLNITQLPFQQEEPKELPSNTVTVEAIPKAFK